MKHIYDKFGGVLYCIRDDGTITDKYDCEVVAHLRGDCITDKFNIDVLYRIRPDGTITDKYDVNIIGHIGEDGTIKDKYNTGYYGSTDYGQNSYSSRSSSDRGLLALLFETILAAIVWIVRWLFKIIKFMWVYWSIPGVLGLTFVGLIVAVSVMIFVFVLPAIGIVLAMIAELFTIVMNVLWLPYWFMTIKQKVKKQITLKEFYKFHWQWFLKGPFVYPEFMVQYREKNPKKQK